MTIGRNDPCPCGSGKKYKKCCLGKGTPAPAARPANFGAMRQPPAPRPRPARTQPALPPLPPPPPPRPLTPEEERAKAFWKDFQSQDLAGKGAIFSRTLDDAEMMDHDMAFEMLNHLHADAGKAGERGRFREFVAALRERRPEVYAEGAHWYVRWLLQDALAEGRSDEVLPLARELAALADRDIDSVNRGLHALAYHDQLSALVEAMRIGWPEVKSSSNVVPWGIAEFAEKGLHYEIYDYLERTPNPSADDPALLDRLRFFDEVPRLEHVAEFIADVTGQSATAWKTEDFTLPPRKRRRDDWDDDEEKESPPDPGVENLSRLINQFVGYLRRVEGIPYPRGELVREDLFQYFIHRHEGKLDPRPSMLEQALHPNKKLPPPPPPGHPLCPERVTLEVQLSRLIGFMNAQYCRMADLFELMPAWLRFLESCHLIDAERRRKTVEELRPLQAELVKVWEKHTEDPTMFRRIQAWPADAEKGPPEGQG